MITSSLNISRNKVPRTFLLVGVFEESVPINWRCLLADRKLEQLGSQDPPSRVATGFRAQSFLLDCFHLDWRERDEITYFFKKLLTQRNGLVAANPFCP